jgi:hypothetical protein
MPTIIKYSKQSKWYLPNLLNKRMVKVERKSQQTNISIWREHRSNSVNTLMSRQFNSAWTGNGTFCNLLHKIWYNLSPVGIPSNIERVRKEIRMPFEPLHFYHEAGARILNIYLSKITQEWKSEDVNCFSAPCREISWAAETKIHPQQHSPWYLVRRRIRRRRVNRQIWCLLPLSKSVDCTSAEARCHCRAPWWIWLGLPFIQMRWEERTYKMHM